MDYFSQKEVQDGEYILIKNAFKQNLNVKRIPNADEEDEDEDDEDDDEDEDQEGGVEEIKE